jgi:hypothetical protein
MESPNPIPEGFLERMDQICAPGLRELFEARSLEQKARRPNYRFGSSSAEETSLLWNPLRHRFEHLLNNTIDTHHSSLMSG